MTTDGKQKTSARVFDAESMTLTDVKAGAETAGDVNEGRAYLYLTASLALDQQVELGLKMIIGSPIIDHKKKVHLNDLALGLGKDFKMKVEGRMPITMDCAQIVDTDRAELKGLFLSGTELGLAISVPVADWAKFGLLVTEYKEQQVDVTIIPGTKQEELPLGEGGK